MKKTRILSFLLVFAMLCGLACIPTVADTNNADDWQLGEGWELNPLTFSFKNQDNKNVTANGTYGSSVDNKAVDSLTFTDPSANAENVGDWSTSADVYFDESYATPNQRIYIYIYTVKGESFEVKFQRRFDAKNLQVGMRYKPNGGSWAAMKAAVNAEKNGATFATANTSDAIWSNNLNGTDGVNTAVSACANFRVAVQSVDGLFKVIVSDAINGNVLFEMVEATADAYKNQADDAVKSIEVKADLSKEGSGTLSTTFFDITNFQTAVNGVASAATADIANYTYGSGWTCATPGSFELKVDNTRAANKTATNNTVIPANAGFELQFTIDVLKNDADARTTVKFAVGSNTVFSRIQRRDDKLCVRIQVNDGSWREYYYTDSGNDKWTNSYNDATQTGKRLPAELVVKISRGLGDNYLKWQISDTAGTPLLVSGNGGNTYTPVDYVVIGGSTAYKGATGTPNLPLNGEFKTLQFAGENSVGAWKYTNMSLKYTTDGTNYVDTAINDYSTWALNTGWDWSNGVVMVNYSKSESSFAKYELLTNTVGDFRIAYQNEFLTLDQQTQNNLEFKLGENTYFIRSGVRSNDNGVTWRNLYMCGVTNGAGQTYYYADVWFDAANYPISKIVNTTVTYDAETATLVMETNFLKDDGTQNWGRTVTVTNGTSWLKNGAEVAGKDDKNVEGYSVTMNTTDVVSGIFFRAGKNEGVYKMNRVLIDTAADVDTTGFKLVGVQDTNPVDNKINVRFVGVLDDLASFQKIGIKVDAYTVANGEATLHKNFDLSTTEVYKAISANVDGVNTKITAKELGGNYLYALTILGVPATGTVKFVVTPYTVDVEDSSNVVDYATYEVVYTNGEYVSGTRV